MILNIPTMKKYIAVALLCVAMCAGAANHDIEVVVHRGANYLAPENTVSSAFAALDHGADWIELDVRCSADSVLYNLHDPSVERTTNGRGFIRDLTSSYIDRLDAGSWFDSRFAGERVPRISEMLDTLSGKCNIFFDVKSGTPVDALVDMVVEKGWADKSFFWFADTVMLKRLVAIAPQLKVKVNASDEAGIAKWIKMCTPAYIEISPQDITPGVKSFCRKHSIKIMAAIQGSDEKAYLEAIAAEPDLVNLDKPELFEQLIDSIALEESIRRQPLAGYVDPRIGSEGLGRVVVGPSMPFGMVRPSPCCTEHPNSGWLPMPEQVNGFAQVLVSGTGGGPKYGNILLMPYAGDSVSTYSPDKRISEDMKLGYYSTTLEKSGVVVEATAARRTSFYRFTYTKDAVSKGLLIDAGFFLGESPEPGAREAQEFVGSQVRILSDYEVEGYSRIRGGWNNGSAYTVYFYAVADKPFVKSMTWKSGSISDARFQYDSNEKTGAVLQFGRNDSTVQVKVGISFVSEMKARQNCNEDIGTWSFEQARSGLVDAWERLFHKIEIDASASDRQKRMFYTALYHTMLMPSDRTGDNPLWRSSEPYYDDFYALWDTYRTSMPLITLIDQDRVSSIVRSLIDIYRYDGYMPDARSGNCNGRTQGGSNAEVVIADAFVKGIGGIDYTDALKAMLKDATVPPGGNEEAEGRGGLSEYLQLGYVPYGIPRAGNRTVEYAYCDYAIAQVAKGLGYDELHDKYLRQSDNWKNLWRSDCVDNGVKGFIMPRGRSGEWIDSIGFGQEFLHLSSSPSMELYKFPYTPTTHEGPWYVPWWNTFFYEGTSWEYSLSIPHDFAGLVELCGGEHSFERRLDKFFDEGYYNPANEPSFMTPFMYHAIGKPWRSSYRIRQILDRYYSDAPNGLPGNDDSGATSAWLAFNMIGLYPNAGQDYYFIVSPSFEQTVLHPAPGVTFRIVARGLSDKKCYIRSITLNGKPYPYSAIRHKDIVAGGTLVLEMTDKPVEKKVELLP